MLQVKLDVKDRLKDAPNGKYGESMLAQQQSMQHQSKQALERIATAAVK
jgi:hypothetical protein